MGVLAEAPFGFADADRGLLEDGAETGFAPGRRGCRGIGWRQVSSGGEHTAASPQRCV